MKQADSIAIVSGGLDSITLVYDMLDKGYTPHMLSFNYGQRHNKELNFAALHAKKLDLRHDIVDLRGLTELISNSALTSHASEHDQIAVPDGHYAEASMKLTVVPNRNMIMLSIAAGVAVNNKYRRIATGVHNGDHFIYPDCRPQFLNHTADAIAAGNEGFHNLDFDILYAPFLNLTKADIAARAIELRVDLSTTWSCYKGGMKHCGRCGTCVERLEAINEAQQRWMRALASDGVNVIAVTNKDTTEYEDTEYWKTAVQK